MRRLLEICTLVPLFAAPLSMVGISSAGQQSPAEALLSRSGAYHDPDGIYLGGALRFDIEMGHSDWWTRDVDLLIDNGRGVFELRMIWNDEVIEVARHGDRWTRRLDGSEQISEADLARHNLTDDALSYWSDYFLFLLGLPVKMLDDGARIDPQPLEISFGDRDVVAIRVTYDPEIGTDTWYLFFDPESARLVGCRFFHDESLGDGDTLVFEGEVMAGSLRLPKSRTWYANDDGRLRGTDTIRSVQIVESRR